jgi:GDP-L-fucose synthase
MTRAMKSSDTIYVAGHRGLAGSAIWRALEAKGFTNVVGFSSSELDLTDRKKVVEVMSDIKPDVVIDAAAKVGGIHANNTYPADFLSQNLQIQTNLMDAANAANVDRLLFLGSSCIYPKFAEQPIKEESLLTGALEATNDAYAIAKIAGIMQVQASRRQFGRRWISAMPTNLYGPGDNFHPENSHVLAALLRRFHEATIKGADDVVVWGSGTPLREFLFVDDLADAVIFLLENYDDPATINIGSGQELTIRQLAELVADVVGFTGSIVQDPTKPDGTPRKVLDTSRLDALGWSATTDIRSGLEKTYAWYLDNQSALRTA